MLWAIMHAARNAVSQLTELEHGGDCAPLCHALLTTKTVIQIAQTERSIYIIFGLVNEKKKHQTLTRVTVSLSTCLVCVIVTTGGGLLG